VNTNYFTKKDNLYLLKKQHYISIIAIALLLVLSVFLYLHKSNADRLPFWLLPFVPIGLVVFEAGKRIEIDVEKKTVTQSYFGFNKTTYPFKDFNHFVLTKHRMNLIYTGTEIKMQFKDNTELSITKLDKKEKVDALLDEIKLLL
jgi:hypothetical protein